ncbi:hypothetical protein BDW22DRAFT_988422 [Trametopsis cervina]|nr:hypothetical protein BDW22DRAFT_988422 [Trametopsis cervina]
MQGLFAPPTRTIHYTSQARDHNDDAYSTQTNPLAGRASQNGKQSAGYERFVCTAVRAGAHSTMRLPRRPGCRTCASLSVASLRRCMHAAAASRVSTWLKGRQTSLAPLTSLWRRRDSKRPSIFACLRTVVTLRVARERQVVPTRPRHSIRTRSSTSEHPQHACVVRSQPILCGIQLTGTDRTAASCVRTAIHAGAIHNSLRLCSCSSRLRSLKYNSVDRHTRRLRIACAAEHFRNCNTYFGNSGQAGVSVSDGKLVCICTSKYIRLPSIVLSLPEGSTSYTSREAV